MRERKAFLRLTDKKGGLFWPKPLPLFPEAARPGRTGAVALERKPRPLDACRSPALRAGLGAVAPQGISNLSGAEAAP